MRLEAIEFLAHVGLGRQQNRLLVESIGVKAGAGLEQCCKLIAEPLADRVSPTPRHHIGPFDEGGHLTESLVQHPPERFALMSPHLRETAERRIEAGQHRSLCTAPLIFAFLRIDDFNHAFDAQDSVKPRRFGRDPAGEVLQRRQDCREHVFVDPHYWCDALAGNSERSLQRSACEFFGRPRAYRYLDRVPSRRQSQPQIQVLGIHRFYFPSPRIGGRPALAAGESGHAGKCHANRVAHVRTITARTSPFALPWPWATMQRNKDRARFTIAAAPARFVSDSDFGSGLAPAWASLALPAWSPAAWAPALLRPARAAPRVLLPPIVLARWPVTARRSFDAGPMFRQRRVRRCRRLQRIDPWCGQDWPLPQSRHAPDWRSVLEAGRRLCTCCRASAG